MPGKVIRIVEPALCRKLTNDQISYNKNLKIIEYEVPDGSIWLGEPLLKDEPILNFPLLILESGLNKIGVLYIKVSLHGKIEIIRTDFGVKVSYDVLKDSIIVL